MHEQSREAETGEISGPETEVTAGESKASVIFDESAGNPSVKAENTASEIPENSGITAPEAASFIKKRSFRTKFLTFCETFLHIIFSLAALVLLLIAALLICGRSSESLVISIIQLLCIKLVMIPMLIILVITLLLECFAVKKMGRLWKITAICVLAVLAASLLNLPSMGNIDSTLRDILFYSGATVPNLLSVAAVYTFERNRQTRRKDKNPESPAE